MIPKKIHYCWFGGNPLPQDALMCIESWKKYFPDYEIIEWNEKNFDMNSCDYIREAAENKKWAFVSDFARFKILYDFGGIYFDTDVEVVRNFDEIIAMGAFMGKEEPQDSTTYVINPGLGMAAEQGNGFCLDVIEYYKTIHFDFNNIITVCEHVTRCLKKKGYIGNNKIENRWLHFISNGIFLPQKLLY
jgi:mannosyltransferase OCH1-like enzyme